VEKEGADRVRVLTLSRNRGKGGAVKRGMMVARGEYLLMVDADGATEMRDVEKLERSLKQKMVMSVSVNTTDPLRLGVAVGSRAHLEQDAVARRTLLRNVLMWGFHFLVAFVGGVRGIKDTQCGFKLFTRGAAAALFPNLHIERWCFDIELLFCTDQIGALILPFHVELT
jgi:dolichyl-phosphate beta-glucosyltransferase